MKRVNLSLFFLRDW